MKVNDFMLCTFASDPNPATPVVYLAQITSIDTEDSTFKCLLVTTGQTFTFSYSFPADEPWTGTDSNGAEYMINTHDIYTAGAMDPYKDGVAVITFSDNTRLFCYVNSVDPATDVSFYQNGAPSMSISDNTVSSSTLPEYPAGSKVTDMEAYVLNMDSPQTETASITTSAATPATEQFFLVDVYSGDLKGKPNWPALAADQRFYGAILKATQGTKGWSNDDGWFKKNWPLLKQTGGERYGSTWFRGAYLFLNFWQDGAAQADNYLDIVDAAGGWDTGDIYPIIDVERGQETSKNHQANKQQVIDCATASAERIRSRTGRNVMLYGRGAMRDLNINDKMGCDVVWNPAYTSTMPMHGLEAWTIDDVALWQYCGDGDAVLDESRFPRSIEDFGKVDISIYVEGSKKPSFANMIKRLGIGTAGI